VFILPVFVQSRAAGILAEMRLHDKSMAWEAIPGQGAYPENANCPCARFRLARVSARDASGSIARVPPARLRRAREVCAAVLHRCRRHRCAAARCEISGT